jgi:hypothetical protein
MKKKDRKQTKNKKTKPERRIGPKNFNVKEGGLLR